jgi:hypothetical protein
MAEVHLPLSITYETTGVTPIGDIIEALQATDDLTRDAAALLPSFIDGLRINKSSLNVRLLSQESPLREIFVVALFVAFQDDLEAEVPPMLENLFNVTVSDDYDTIVTVAFLAVVFYGVGLAIDAAKKMVCSSLPRERYHELAALLARQTGKTPDNIERIIRAHFEKPSAARRLARQAKRVFLPSQRDQNAPMVVDRDRIGSELIREIPYVQPAEKFSDFDRYTPYEAVELKIHAMDRDKSATGWAAVASAISDRRLKVRVMDPVKPSDLWGKDGVKADVVLVSKLTSDGYVPVEIQITSILSHS